MDPNIMKFLEEDEDETMHSGADVEAFTAELNRDIEGSNSSTLQQPCDTNAGSSHTISQFRPQWHTSSHDGIATSESGQDIVAMGEKDPHSSELELQRHDSDLQNRLENDNSSCEPNRSIVAGLQQQDIQSIFPLPQLVGGRPRGEQCFNAQVMDHEGKSDNKFQMNKLQNISHRPSMAVGSNDQQPLSVEVSDTQILHTSNGNQQTSTGISVDQVTPPLNQHTAGIGMTSQQAITSGISNSQAMTSTSQQTVIVSKLNKQVPIGMLLPLIHPQLDKDRAMRLRALHVKLKKSEIPKDDFFSHMRSIVGDQMIKRAVLKLQTQAARNSQTAPNQYQTQSQVSGRKLPVPSAPLPTGFSNSVSDDNAAKSCEVERQEDSHGAHTSQMSTSSSGALIHGSKHPAFPAQGLNKQQHMQSSQAYFSTYGSAGSGYPPFPESSDASSVAIRPLHHDSKMRQAPSHSNLAVNHLGPTSQPMNATNISTFDRPHSLNDPKKIPAGNLTNMSSNTALQQNQVQWPSSTSREQKVAISPSMTHVKQEPFDQSNEQQKSLLSASHGLSSLSPASSKLGSAPGNLNDEFEIHSYKPGPTPSTTLVPSSSVSSPRPNPMETNILSNSRMPSLTAPIGPANNSKVPPKKPLVSQKKPTEEPGSSSSSKKPKVSGSFADQSIEHLNDVTAVSGVDLQEEEQLLSGPKEDSRVSEASRRIVQEEEERLILQKIPLKKKMVEIMAKFGLKNMTNDVEQCLSLCVEERLCGLLSNVIRLSKQRVDMEKPRHKTIITSDVRQKIMAINRKAREEWDRKQAETETSQKQNELESSTGVDADKEKDENRGKSTKVNKDEDDKMRATAANVAVRAATGVGDITSRWQSMIEAKKQGGSDTSSGLHTNNDVGQKPLATSTRSTRENQEFKRRDPSVSLATRASIRKVGRNQGAVPRVARSITVKDVIAILEREIQMSKSMLLYQLYHKFGADAVTE